MITINDGSCAFDNCFELQSIEIPKDSKLRIIESYAFSNTSIKYLNLPSSLTHICQRSFDFCESLNRIIFNTNSKLQIVDKKIFNFPSYSTY